MSDVPVVTQLIDGRARTKTQAHLTPKAGQQPRQAQVTILLLQVKPQKQCRVSQPSRLSPGERRLFWLLTEGLMAANPTLGK